MRTIHVLRKPCSEPTVAANVLRFGTGGLNVDGCRIGTEGEALKGSTVRSDIRGGRFGAGESRSTDDLPKFAQQPGGRWPANVLHDGSVGVVSTFPESKSPTTRTGAGWRSDYVGGEKRQEVETVIYANDGSAARYFQVVFMDRTGTSK